jgi:hypothetical protein
MNAIDMSGPAALSGGAYQSPIAIHPVPVQWVDSRAGSGVGSGGICQGASCSNTIPDFSAVIVTEIVDFEPHSPDISWLKETEIH